MDIIFDRNTKLRKMQRKLLIFPDILEKSKTKITEIVSRETFDFFAMTVEEFLRLQENELPKTVNKLLKKRSFTFYQYVQILNTFEQGAKAFQQILEDTTIEQTSEEKAASAGLIDISPEESMLAFLVDFYKLKSMEEAQKVSLYEYITARKISYNNAKFQKNMINIQKVKI